MYVGYGMKKGDPSYNPVEPPAVCGDPEEEKEMPEPNPLKEPEPVAAAEGEGEEE